MKYVLIAIGLMTLPICVALITVASIRWRQDTANNSTTHGMAIFISCACIVINLITIFSDTQERLLLVSGLGALCIATAVLSSYVYKAITRKG